MKRSVIGMVSGKKPVNRRKRIKISAKALRSFKIALGALLILANVAAFALSGILGSIHYLDDKDMQIGGDVNTVDLDSDQDLDSLFGDSDGTGTTSASDTIDSLQMEEIDKEIIESKVDENGLRYQEGVTNVLLMGTDGWRRTSKKTVAPYVIGGVHFSLSLVSYIFSVIFHLLR